MSVCIYGVGTTTFGKHPDETASSLVWTAVREALADAGIDRVDAVYVGTAFGEMGIAQRALQGLGITDVPVVTVENACASGTTGFHEGYEAIRTGRYETVLAVGVEHLTSRFAGPIVPEARDPEGRTGLALPALYAMAATRYMEVHGVTAEQLAQVSVKNHQHSLGNPRAQYRKALTIEEVLASRPIAEPLTLLQCCGIADGAGAAVLGPARGVDRDVAVRGSVLRSGKLWDHRTDHVWGYDIVRRTAQAVYDQAGVAPEDVDVLEVHDAFTIGEIVTTEALGLAEEGTGAKLLDTGHTALGGAQPVNPSGGLLSRGHPLGCTGLAQLAEITWQLRGDAGDRQVPAARLGLVETMGGGVSGLDGNACVVTVLEA